ncbi:aminotransferase class I/II-fold pyridoxal phosphate-dependent enzyme [Bradyrhizobium sp. WYCCWR 13022]|uniref:aminotransferase class I/II-fold pyridoxal phosphate-dependent enzyme n=1 Tax=Bradyrhizobium TaxID=374 RepID=UPI002112A2C6|nr:MULTISPECIES: aminotransferase class I/II-fold pyridoxal phosphate-dependent enzyme [Bradyrhizobium]MDN4985455.1 aminotransferase class I/II-fold pyridoxal phosphate-dependent enzyme [Bradyrhizobium sp. WYCCWR 13022]MDN5002313.1 aminotransferase class I/II-fold pyridoxal phosphate-dependent enzyme [Bradyrhizobium sp. WYCCWR 12677]
MFSDECYSSFVFTRERHESIVMAQPGVRSRTILVNAFSKELAITRWRLGYLAAPRRSFLRPGSCRDI